MNLVILAGDSPVSAYLVQQIAGRNGAPRVVRPVDAPGGSGKSKWAKLKAAPYRAITNALRHRFYARYARLLNRRISEQLFNSPIWPTPSDVEKVPERTINSPESAQVFQSLEPDVLLVCGAPILKQEIFSIPRICAVNVHFGIAPHYRGEYALFWPLYLGDYDNIGITLHAIDEGIDTGNILARGYPALDSHDTEATIWAKCARMMAEIVLELLEGDEQAWLSGAPQETGGRLFYSRERTMWRGAHYLWNRRVLNRRPPDKPARVDRYFGDVANQDRHGST